MTRQSANAFKTSSIVRGSAYIMVSGGKKSGKSVEDVFKSGMDDMIRAREELDAAEAETEKVKETVQPASADSLQSSAPSGPPMSEAAPEPASDSLLAPLTPTGPPMPEAAPEPVPDLLLGSQTPSGPPMGDPGPMPPMGGPGAMPPMGGPSAMPPMGGPGPMPPMGGPGPMPPMGGPGPMPPMGGPGLPPSGPPSEGSDVPTEAPSMSVDSSAMPPMGGLDPMPSADPLVAEQPVVDSLAADQPAADPPIADLPIAEPEIEAPPQVTEQVKPKIDNFGVWESHFDDEWKGGATVFEGDNAPPEPEERFDEVSWDSSARPVKTVPSLPNKSVLNKMNKGDLIELAEGREVSSDGTINQIIERLLAPEAHDSEDLTPPEDSPATDTDTTSTEAPPVEDVDLMSIAGTLTDDADLAPPTEPPADGPGPMPPSGPPKKGGPGPMPPAGPPKKGGPGPMPPSRPPADE